MGQREIDRLATADKPWISNYKPLQEWLHKVNARCMTQDAVGEDYHEKWAVNGRLILVEVRARKNGWEIWTLPYDTGRLAEAFAVVERSVGLVPPEAPAAPAPDQAHDVDLQLPWSVDADASYHSNGLAYVIISDAKNGIPFQSAFLPDEPEDEAQTRALAERLCEIVNAHAPKVPA